MPPPLDWNVSPADPRATTQKGELPILASARALMVMELRPRMRAKYMGCGLGDHRFHVVGVVVVGIGGIEGAGAIVQLQGEAGGAAGALGEEGGGGDAVLGDRLLRRGLHGVAVGGSVAVRQFGGAGQGGGIGEGLQLPFGVAQVADIDGEAGDADDGDHAHREQNRRLALFIFEKTHDEAKSFPRRWQRLREWDCGGRVPNQPGRQGQKRGAIHDLSRSVRCRSSAPHACFCLL